MNKHIDKLYKITFKDSFKTIIAISYLLHYSIRTANKAEVHLLTDLKYIFLLSVAFLCCGITTNVKNREKYLC